jgi:FdhD protein
MQSTQKVFENRDTDSDSKKEYSVIKCDGAGCLDSVHDLIGEEPLMIRVEDHPYSVVMRTPGDETFHAAGFCLSEGIVDDINDFVTIGFCEDMDRNVIDVKLKPERREKVSSLLERKGFISQTSCGICGKVLIDEISQILTPTTDNTKILIGKVYEAGGMLPDIQHLYPITRGSHAVMILNRDLDILSTSEDVGRHNAFDKAIGKLLMTRKLTEAFMGVLSSRISFEMIQKANRAGIPFLLSGSRPTALAADLGKSMNMTIACLGDESELIIFSGKERILR